jgi:deoxyribose-phosphate aldolase
LSFPIIFISMPFNLASYIDHTVLKDTTSIADVDQVCREAVLENFAAVCIPLKYVVEAKELLGDSMVKVATVIAFPHGTGHWSLKVKEIEDAIAKGADEVDMVIDINALKSGNLKYLEEEIRACLEPVLAAGKVIKVIVESGILTENELKACCEIYGNHKIHFMKTSTGFAKVGATVSAVQFMRANLPASMGIKAAGGIRNYQFAKELIDAGATRLGCSASMQIMKEFREEMHL